MAANNGPPSAPHDELVSSWVFDCGYRGTLSIVYGCAVVLVAAVWTVVHPNVPATGESHWRVIRRRVRWGLVAVFAPDFLTLVAASQWQSAKEALREMSELDGTAGWSLEHAFYANSGGFVLQTPDTALLPINSASLHYLLSRGYILLPAITRHEIWDKSKADVFAKGLAILQGGWIIVQAVARTAQGLPLAPLEIFTLAFVVSTAMSYYFWWRKPQHVSTPTVLSCLVPMSQILVEAGYPPDAAHDDAPMDFVEKPLRYWKRRPMFAEFDLERGGDEGTTELEGEEDPTSPPPLEVIKQGHLDFNWLGLDRERREGSKDGKGGNALSPLFEDRGSAPAINQGSNGVSNTEGSKNPEREALGSEGEKAGEDGRAEEGEAEPTGERLANTKTKTKTTSHPNGKGKGMRLRIPNDSILPNRLPLKLIILLILPSLLHGATHLIGWNHQFPTQVELHLWRASVIALLIASCLAVGLMRILGAVGYRGRYTLLWVWVNVNATSSTTKQPRVFHLPGFWDATISFLTLLLVVARCFIIAEVVASLRLLPAATFTDVNWPNFIPHV